MLSRKYNVTVRTCIAPVSTQKDHEGVTAFMKRKAKGASSPRWRVLKAHHQYMDIANANVHANHKISARRADIKTIQIKGGL